jgi:hypothetical protein
MTVSKSASERLRDLLFRLGGRPLVLILLLIPLGWRCLDADPWPSLRRTWFARSIRRTCRSASSRSMIPALRPSANGPGRAARWRG